MHVMVDDTDYRQYASSPIEGGGLEALLRDIKEVHRTSKVPEYLNWYVPASKDTQRQWYKELFNALHERVPEDDDDDDEAAKFVRECLENVHPDGVSYMNLQGFLQFYGLPRYNPVLDYPLLRRHLEFDPQIEPKPKPWEFELFTLPVISKQVTDGCGFNVSVEIEFKDFCKIPPEIVYAITERRRALNAGDSSRAREMLIRIHKTEDYEVVNRNGDEILTTTYQIRLRGIRMRISGTLDGSQAKEELKKMVATRCLTIKVSRVDNRNRCFGDVYYNDKLLQGILLKRRDVSCYWESVDPGEEDQQSQ